MGIKATFMIGDKMDRYKYPRTLHLPASQGATSDDKMLTEDQVNAYYTGKTVAYTEKMDGENTTMYNDYIHARSIDSRHHNSRNWVKRFHSEIAHQIPDGWRICGENLFAKHSISYDNLDSYFYGFSIWDEYNLCVPWSTTQKIFNKLGIQCVPLVTNIDSVMDSNFHKKLGEDLVAQGKEGFVMRNIHSFNLRNFDKNVAKYVRANHVTTNKHWAHQEIIPNKLKG